MAHNETFPTDLFKEPDYESRCEIDTVGTLLPGTSIEIMREPGSRGRYRHVLFDFDGTLSLIREGWPDVMIPMMVEIISSTPDAEPEAELTRLVSEYVMRLNGKQTIYQMLQLADEVRKRGGIPEDPLAYKHEYHCKLMRRIADRWEALRVGNTMPEEMLVPHTLELLDGLARLGLPVYIASGTDERYVREEAELLGLKPYFEDRIYGAIDDYQNFSKQMVIERILSENQVDGKQLLGFGDGYVEIDNVRSVGGAAVGVASDETHRSGKPDPWKRERLIGVGADLIIPDYSDHTALIDYLFPAMS